MYEKSLEKYEKALTLNPPQADKVKEKIQELKRLLKQNQPENKQSTKASLTMKKNSCPRDWRMPFILALMLLLTLSGCAPVLFKKPLSDQELGKVVSLLKAQEEAANAFYTTGQMVVKDWYWDQEANTLMAGTRTPLRLRMEITHAWGQPILHLLVVGRTFKALSYGEEKTLYRRPDPGGSFKVLSRRS